MKEIEPRANGIVTDTKSLFENYPYCGRLWLPMAASSTKMGLQRSSTTLSAPFLSLPCPRKPRSTSQRDNFQTGSKTGLEWKTGPDKNMSWDEAKSWVQMALLRQLLGRFGGPVRASFHSGHVFLIAITLCVGLNLLFNQTGCPEFSIRPDKWGENDKSFDSR